ncbi:hypothetical protein AGLY_006352 [Aphis glycines]|uniref:Uncharacterized protein n=1 Tax=Aphis glycines TaxID=307491 RepID=A0A6G0TRP8_APHGL|nr:hypothetical protein AGLY_006352 [Aphis glycines]
MILKLTKWPKFSYLREEKTDGTATMPTCLRELIIVYHLLKDWHDNKNLIYKMNSDQPNSSIFVSRHNIITIREFPLFCRHHNFYIVGIGSRLSTNEKRFREKFSEIFISVISEKRLEKSNPPPSVLPHGRTIGVNWVVQVARMSLLSNYFKSLEGLDDILVYFDSTYVNGIYKSTMKITEYGTTRFLRHPPIFLLHMWNVYNITKEGYGRINNVSEGFNKK